jgi:hypothetical protein
MAWSGKYGTDAIGLISAPTWARIGRADAYRLDAIAREADARPLQGAHVLHSQSRPVSRKFHHWVTSARSVTASPTASRLLRNGIPTGPYSASNIDDRMHAPAKGPEGCRPRAGLTLLNNSNCSCSKTMTHSGEFMILWGLLTKLRFFHLHSLWP